MKKNSNIVHMCGGLGNQLFLYALSRQFLRQGITVAINNYYFHSSGWDGSPYELDKLGINMIEEKPPFLIDCYIKNESLIGKILRRIPKLKLVFKEKNDMTFDPEVLNLTQTYIIGYFQSEKYFEDVADRIKQEIVFSGYNSDDEQQFAEQMQSCNSVAVHVRLGDYLKYSDIYGNCATLEYYKNALSYIKKQIKNPVFYLFSNDISLAQSFFPNEKLIPVDINKGEKSYLDMYLMTQCKHAIIANSSFSWWGAWLNSNPDKIVLAPKRWLNDRPTPDVWAKGWIKI